MNTADMPATEQICEAAEATETPVSARTQGSPSRAATASLWLASIAFMLLGYGLAWQRGPYADDYALRDSACDVVTGESRPIWSHVRIETFPVRTLNWVIAGIYAASIPQYEWLTRALAATVVGLNCVLLAFLIYRILHSRLAAITAGWLFIAPFYAQEALLWAGAAGYLVAMTLALVSLHCLVSLLVGTRWPMVLLMAALLGMAASLFAIEQAVVLASTFPLFAFCAYIARKPPPRHYRRFAILSAVLLGVTVCLLGFLALMIYSGSVAQISGRGGFTKSPVEILDKCGQFLNTLRDMAVSDWGRTVTREAFVRGVRVQGGSAQGVILVLAVISGVTLLVWRWRTRPADYQAPLSAGALLVIVSCLCLLLVLCFPGALVRGQILERRMLYIPSALAAVLAAAVIWLPGRLLVRSRWVARWERMAVVLLGIGTWYCVTCLAGYAEAYRQRSRLDARHLAATRQSLTRAILPAGTLIVPFGSDEALDPQSSYLSILLSGVFEKNFAVYPELSRILGRRDFRVLTTNRWVGMSFEPVDQADGQTSLKINGDVVPTAQTLLLTCRDDRAYVVRELVLCYPDGRERVLAFPIAEKLSQAGAAGVRAAVDAGIAQFQMRFR